MFYVTPARRTTLNKQLHSMEDPVGLSILIHTAGTHNPKVVAKSTIMAPSRRRSVTPMLPGRLRFLKSCFLCYKELSPHKDIYIYRDRAFCSKECRCRQMSRDEKREFEDAIRQRTRARMARRFRQEAAEPVTTWVGAS